MTDVFRDLYDSLVKGLEEIEKRNADMKKQIEEAFHLAERVRRRAEEVFSSTVFSSANEEIEFFRHTKPLFTSAVEFYSILYRAELFIPDAVADRREFWGEELQRAEHFLARHATMLNYLKSGDSSRDTEYFGRQPGADSAPMDELVAKLQARQQYIEYIRDRMLPALGSA